MTDSHDLPVALAFGWVMVREPADADGIPVPVSRTEAP
jgi:hypothetical protein